MKFYVIVEFDAEEKVYNVSVPSLPGCFTWGKTREEAVANSIDAIRCYVDMLKSDGQTIPSAVDLQEVTV